MRDPIEVNYLPDGDDWTVTAKGRGQTLTGRAPGLIAARDRADQLVEKLAPDEEHRTVVHLLDGDAVEFTTAYLTARLTKPEPPEVVEVPVDNPAGEAVDEAVDNAVDKAKDKAADTAEAAEPAQSPEGAEAAPRPNPRPAAPVPAGKSAESSPQPGKAEEPASP